MTFGRHELTPSELALVMEAERAQAPFVALRDAAAELELVELGGDRLCIGREPDNDLVIAWDAGVSRVHALLERLGGAWTIVDDDLSRNGTFVNGQRLRGRRRLEDRDVLRFSKTELLYRDPTAEAGETPRVHGPEAVAGVSAGQQRVLVALCRPLLEDAELGATPPSNSELAESLGISIEAVRSHLKALFRLFEIPDLPQNRKRAELARRALASAVVIPRDLSDR